MCFSSFNVLKEKLLKCQTEGYGNRVEISIVCKYRCENVKYTIIYKSIDLKCVIVTPKGMR